MGSFLYLFHEAYNKAVEEIVKDDKEAREILNCWVMVNYIEMFSGILALSIMGLLIFKLIDMLENKLCKWIKIGKKNII